MEISVNNKKNKLAKQLIFNIWITHSVKCGVSPLLLLNKEIVLEIQRVVIESATMCSSKSGLEDLCYPNAPNWNLARL